MAPHSKLGQHQGHNDTYNAHTVIMEGGDGAEARINTVRKAFYRFLGRVGGYQEDEEKV